ALDADGGLAEEALRILEPLLGAAASLGGGEQEPEGELHQLAVVFPDGQVVQVVSKLDGEAAETGAHVQDSLEDADEAAVVRAAGAEEIGGLARRGSVLARERHRFPQPDPRGTRPG